jgi:hypothetical protein
MKISKKELKQIIREEIQAVLDEKKKKTKVKSKADQEKISAMIGKLISKEGKPADQATAIAYSKYERGEL